MLLRRELKKYLRRKNNMKIVKNEEAVSPVIGVILMVAITVILAAVIAAFVFNIGGTQQKTPVVSLTAVSASSSTGNITINHAGGDAVDLNRVKAIIEQGTSRSTISLLNGTGVQYLYAGDKLVIQQKGNGNNTVAVNGVGVAVPSYASGNTNLTLASGVVTITLIDTTSSQQIASITASAS